MKRGFEVVDLLLRSDGIHARGALFVARERLHQVFRVEGVVERFTVERRDVRVDPGEEVRVVHADRQLLPEQHPFTGFDLADVRREVDRDDHQVHPAEHARDALRERLRGDGRGLLRFRRSGAFGARGGFAAVRALFRLLFRYGGGSLFGFPFRVLLVFFFFVSVFFLSEQAHGVLPLGGGG